MAVDIINEVRLFKCGTNQISVRVEDFKAWFTILGSCTGNGDNFFTLNKADWDILKKFIDSQLTYSNIIEITAIEPLQLQ